LKDAFIIADQMKKSKNFYHIMQKHLDIFRCTRYNKMLNIMK
jgi:hypothetical protein